MKNILGFTILDFYRLDLDPEKYKARKKVISTATYERFFYGLGSLAYLEKKYLSRLNSRKIIPLEKDLLMLVSELMPQASEPLRKSQDMIIEVGKDAKEDELCTMISKEFASPKLHKYARAISFSTDQPINAKYFSCFGNVKPRRQNIFRIPRFLPRIETGVNWNLEDINAYEAQNISEGKNTLVAVIDTGVDYSHYELSERFGALKGYDFIKGDEYPMDLNGHGTHVAGTIAGKKTGIARQCTLLAYRVLDAQGSGTEADVISAIESSIDAGVDVINMSLGSPEYSMPLEQVCLEAAKRGIIVAAAAGNDGSNEYNYPASLPGVVSVAATDRNRRLCYFSNMNDMTDIAAPGEDIYSTLPADRYGIFSGTSMASPHIAGVASLARSLDLEGIEQRMKDSGNFLEGQQIKIVDALGAIR